MTIHSPADIAQIWVINGGSVTAQAIMTAVALAESGGNDQAISSSHDYGLWQINTINFAHLGLTTASALNPNNSARAAITMSGNGTNVAAWCTCWTDPDRDCGHGFISSPQPGSPAWNQLSTAAAAVNGAVSGAPTVTSTSGMASAQSAWAALTSALGSDARTRYAHLAGEQTAIKEIPR